MGKTDKKILKHLKPDEMLFLCSIRKEPISNYKKRNDCNAYRITISPKEDIFLKQYKQSKDVDPSISSEENLKSIALKKKILLKEAEVKSTKEQLEELTKLLDIKNEAIKFESYELVPSSTSTSKDTVAIACLSDVHIEEEVTLESTMHLNSYNLEIAQKRLENFFLNLTKLIHHHQKNYQIKKLILAILGDIISNWIHDSLKQTNQLSPTEAIAFASRILSSGLKYLNDNLNVDSIDVICICGNHGRYTEKQQFTNFTQTSYEYLMYKNLEEFCKLNKLNKLNFIVPTSTMAVVKIFDKNILFTHGHQFKYNGGIGGIYIPMLRWFYRIASTLNIDKAFIGHWHTLLNIPEVAVNGSVIGFNSYALNLGFKFELPQQLLYLLNEKRGFVNHQPIYLE